MKLLFNSLHFISLCEIITFSLHVFVFLRNVIASQIMAKYGWKEGQGLGREEQGLSTCLEVEKTGKRAGKIINKDIQKQKEKKDGFAVPLNPPAFAPPSEFGPPPSFAPPPEFAPPPSFAPPPEFMTSQNDDSPSMMQNESNITDLMKTPSKVVLLKVKSRFIYGEEFEVVQCDVSLLKFFPVFIDGKTFKSFSKFGSGT